MKVVVLGVHVDLLQLDLEVLDVCFKASSSVSHILIIILRQILLGRLPIEGKVELTIRNI